LHELGDKTLADLDFDDYDHIWNQENIEASWARTEWVEGAQNYVYPLVDYGRSVNMVNFPIENFKPAVFISEILKRIFAEAGFTIIAPFFSSFYFRKLILLTAEKTITREVTKLLEQTTNLFIDPVTDTPSYEHILTFLNVEASGFDVTGGDTFTWTRTQPLNTGATFNARLSFVAINAPTNNTWTIQITRGGVPVLSQNVVVDLNSVGAIFNWDVEIAGGITLEENQEYQVKLIGQANTGFDLSTQVIIQQLGVFAIGNTVPVAVELE